MSSNECNGMQKDIDLDDDRRSTTNTAKPHPIEELEEFLRKYPEPEIDDSDHTGPQTLSHSKTKVGLSQSKLCSIFQNITSVSFTNEPIETKAEAVQVALQLAMCNIETDTNPHLTFPRDLIALIPEMKRYFER